MKTPHFGIDREIVLGTLGGLVIGAVVLALAWPRPSAPPTLPPASPTEARAAPVEPPLPRVADFGAQTASPGVRTLAGWVMQTANHEGRSFVVIDKKQARVYVFDRDGTLAGSSPVLLGFAAGDHTVPGIGDRPLALVKPSERTTPAGRFVAEPGHNLNGEEVLWVDYDAAVSMHRVRATNPKERRLERLATPSVADNRISYGCINVPVAFFEQTLWPRVQVRPPVVYVLPEKRPLNDVFPGVMVDTASGRAAARRPSLG
jgi:hypothetical protein